MASGSSTPSSGRVALHLSTLAAKVDEVAERAGVPTGERSDLEATLAALPWRDRRRLGLVLESARVSASSGALLTAVDMILELAAEVWAKTLPPGERESERH